jgi:Bardet-Biedl syndrome 1 protein
LDGVPTFLIGEGTYDIDYKVFAACRNGYLYIVSGDKVETQIKIDSKPISIARLDKSLVVAAIDNTVQCYSTKGKKNWSI